MFINEQCKKCRKSILKKDLKEKPNFWVCPRCNTRNYKHLAKGWLREGGNSKKFEVRKTTICTDFNKSIMEKKGKKWTHEVKNKNGKVIHNKHNK